jgi:hypothetical protein
VGRSTADDPPEASRQTQRTRPEQSATLRQLTWHIHQVGYTCVQGRDGRFEIGLFTDADQDYIALFDGADQDHLALYDAGKVTAVDGFGVVLAEIRLSDLAVYLSHSTEEIKYSFLDPNGGRLLTVNEGEIA